MSVGADDKQLKMGVKKLDLPCANGFRGLSADPEPDWDVDDLISELNALELKLNAPTMAGRPPLITESLEFNTREGIYSCNTFVMGVSDGDLEDSDSDDVESIAQNLMTGRRFSCVELDFTSDSESSEDGSDIERIGIPMVDKTRLVEGFLFELERERQLRVKEEIREKISALEADLMSEKERSASALILVEKYEEAKRGMDRRLDKQHQRKIAEARDTWLSAVQRDHEQKSQIEERKIRNDAAIEEARRKEKERQEIAKAEEKARLKAKAAADAQKAALEAERKAAIEAAEAAQRELTEAAQRAAAEAAEKVAKEQMSGAQKETTGEAKEENAESKKSGIKVKAAETALKLEAERSRKFMEFAEQNQALRTGSNTDFGHYERQIGVRMRQITGSQENVRTKSSELVKIIRDPHCPQSISLMAFAHKVFSQVETHTVSLNYIAFAIGHVIVLVTSQVPDAMDLILAEFHSVCIFSVPKYIYYSKSTFKTKEDYYKMIGFRTEDGKLESTDSYLVRIKAYMTLYAALVQTEVGGARNLHGIKEGWAWLARFMNELPANRLTAVALDAFLKIAGFAMYRRYRGQFIKILNIISREFLVSLKEQGDPKMNVVIDSIETYLETKQFLKEPQDRNLPATVESKFYRA